MSPPSSRYNNARRKAAWKPVAGSDYYLLSGWFFDPEDGGNMLIRYVGLHGIISHNRTVHNHWGEDLKPHTSSVNHVSSYVACMFHWKVFNEQNPHNA
jgi:hypothetical protein